MHTCPECGQACYCGGDIDDIECDPSAASRCTHCDGTEPDDELMEPTRDKTRDPQPGDEVNGRTVTRRIGLWVEYKKDGHTYQVRVETWTRCVCHQSA